MQFLLPIIITVTICLQPLNAADTLLRGGSFMDPKSIEEKEAIYVDVEEGSSSTTATDIATTTTTTTTATATINTDVPLTDYSELQFLFFGTSRTYGAMLEDRTTMAFPALLGGANALNLGIPSGGPDHPLACTYSMLHKNGVNDDQSFDVIVLEYSDLSFYSALQLARRLRQRFPKALILFLDMWLMVYFQNVPSGKTLDAWSLQRGFATGGVGGEIEPRLAQRVMNKTKVEDWVYLTEELAYSDGHKQRISQDKDVLGHVVTAPIPANAHEALSLPYREYFFRDMHHFSVRGHEYVANLIRTYMIEEVHFRTYHDPTVAPWEHTDQCNHWLKTGIIDPTLVTSYRDGMALNEFNPSAHKFALEVPEPQGWFTVQNNIEGFAQLTIEYMITGPDCMYPEMKLSIQTSEAQPSGESNEPIVLGCVETPYPYQVHISHQIRIGTIPPGGSTVFLEAVSESADPAVYAQKWPFRIIAVNLTPVSAFSQNPVTSRFHVS